VWAVSGADPHSINWDMAAPGRQRQFTRAAEMFVSDVVVSAERKRIGRPDEMVLRFDGHPMMRQHLRNARKYEGPSGTSLWKGHRSSSRKIDLAVCAVGARMLRRLVLNKPVVEKALSGKKSGKVWS